MGCAGSTVKILLDRRCRTTRPGPVPDDHDEPHSLLQKARLSKSVAIRTFYQIELIFTTHLSLIEFINIFNPVFCEIHTIFRFKLRFG